MLIIKDLHAEAEGKPILQGINLSINKGEVHAIMGPNGSGKSTLSKVISGHPSYQVTRGEILYLINNRWVNIVDMAPDIRAKEGLFLAFQYPVEVPGVNNAVFLRTSFNEVCKHQGIPEMDPFEFKLFLKDKLRLLNIDKRFLDRPVNTDFSGGEKKRNEILQMAVLSPRLAFLDETDSGLDVDALRVVSEGINTLKSSENAVVLVTHYQRLLDYIVPDVIHVLIKGKVVKTGDKHLAREIEEKGFDFLT